MTVRFIALLLLAALGTLGPAAPAGAQSVGDVFRRVSPSVVVIRSRDATSPRPARSASERSAPGCSSRATAR